MEAQAEHLIDYYANDPEVREWMDAPMGYMGSEYVEIGSFVCPGEMELGAADFSSSHCQICITNLTYAAF